MLLPFALQAAEPESAGFASERLARVDAYVEQQIAAGRLAGAVVTVARHGQVVHDSAYGHANLETRRTMRGDELFRL
jgi:CubicO group peptidase (beta-lactamase class C family)